MKNIFIGLFILLSACSQSTQDKTESVNRPADGLIVEVSNLQLQNGLIATPDAPLTFGTTTPLSPTLTSVITLKNSGSGSVPLVIATPGENGFSMKLNRCPANLVKNATCQITMQFSARALFNGSQNSVLTINEATLALKAEVSGQINPDTDGIPHLKISLNLPFDPLNNNPQRTITILNDGTGVASNFIVSLPPEYIISVNRCGSTLKPTKTCSLLVNFKNYRQESTVPAVTLSISMPNQPTVSLDLKTGNPPNTNPAPSFTVKYSLLSPTSNGESVYSTKNNLMIYGHYDNTYNNQVLMKFDTTKPISSGSISSVDCSLDSDNPCQIVYANTTMGQIGNVVDLNNGHLVIIVKANYSSPHYNLFGVDLASGAVQELVPGFLSSDSGVLAEINGKAYISGDVGSTTPLIETDGTISGTKTLFNIASIGFRQTYNYSKLGNKILFNAGNTPLNGSPANPRSQLFYSFNLTLPYSKQGQFPALCSQGSDNPCVIVDPTTSATSTTVIASGSGIPFNNGLIFGAKASSSIGYELYYTDGVTASLIKDLNPVSEQSSSPGLFFNFGNKIVFIADTPDYGREFWITDGTSQGTTLINDLIPGPGSPSPIPEEVVGNEFLFIARNESYTVNTLYKSNGTSSGTSVVYAPGVYFDYYVNVGSDFYFFSTDDVYGSELRKRVGNGYVTIDTSPGDSLQYSCDYYDYDANESKTTYFANQDDCWNIGGQPGDELSMHPTKSNIQSMFMLNSYLVLQSPNGFVFINL